VKKGLEDQVAAQSEEIQMLNIQIRALNQALRETETRLKADFQKQMQFNTANENQIKRVQGKVTAGEAVLREINGLMSKYLKKKGRVLTTEERMNLDSYEFSFMIPDFEVFVEQYNELLKIKQLYAALREEKEYVLTYINGYGRDNWDLQNPGD
jgi:small-conductance mechanosensitive channel